VRHTRHINNGRITSFKLAPAEWGLIATVPTVQNVDLTEYSSAKTVSESNVKPR
jgi:hypothetical protein